MGVNFKELIVKHPITLESLKGKIIIIDGYNTLYQFLSNIRGRDGNLFTDSKGRVTSHLIGLFSRTTNLMTKGIKLAFVFDGRVPELKHKELQKRKAIKEEAEKKYQEALESEDQEGMQKYAARTSRLTRDMVDDAKTLLKHLGIPVIQAPSEGEAQAAHMVAKGDAYAVGSQDYDSLLYGAPKLIQYISVEGRRKQPGKFAYTNIEPQMIDLQENLKALGLTRDQLTWLAMLIGTDYAPSGVKGIGPKKGLALVKAATIPEDVFGKYPLEEAPWQEVLQTFQTIPVTDDYDLTWHSVNKKELVKFLVEERDFSLERIQKTLDAIAPKQQGLGGFL